MDPRFVTKTIHAWLDYPVALSLIILPFVLGLGTDHPVALWLAVVTGVAALGLTLLTDHATGVFKIVPYSVHLAVDALVGLAFVLAPMVLGLLGLDAWYYGVNGAAVLLVCALHRPETQDLAA